MSPGRSSSPRPLSGSLLVADCRVNPAGPETASWTVTEAVTATSRWSGGQSTAGVARQSIAGGTVSIFTVTETEVVSPAVFVARQVSTVPAVWLVSVAGSQPVALAMPDGSLTVQVTVTGTVVCQPLPPAGGDTWAVTTGGAVTRWNSANGESELTTPQTVWVPVSTEVVRSTQLPFS